MSIFSWQEKCLGSCTTSQDKLKDCPNERCIIKKNIYSKNHKSVKKHHEEYNLHIPIYHLPKLKCVMTHHEIPILLTISLNAEKKFIPPPVVKGRKCNMCMQHLSKCHV